MDFKKIDKSIVEGLEGLITLALVLLCFPVGVALFFVFPILIFTEFLNADYQDVFMLLGLEVIAFYLVRALINVSGKLAKDYSLKHSK